MRLQVSPEVGPGELKGRNQGPKQVSSDDARSLPCAERTPT